MRTGFEGKVAVITGASRGIGAAVARMFLAQGLRVAGCARKAPSGAEALAGDDAFFVALDVRDPLAVDAFAGEVQNRFGVPDLWINNAGVLAPMGMARSLPSDGFRTLMDINVLGVFHGTAAYLRRLHESGRRGTLINVSSGAGRRGYAGWSAYCASKAAVDNFTRAVAEEERPHGVRVYAVAPGIIDTAMQELIRTQTPEDLPMVERFRRLHADGALLDPASPAAAFLHLAFAEELSFVDPVIDLRDTPALAGLPALKPRNR